MIPFFDLSVWLIVKVIMLFALLIYLVFASVVVRQVYLMTDTVHTGFEFPLKTLAWAHLFIAIGIFIFALLIL